jgi:hypothetical protein
MNPSLKSALFSFGLFAASSLGAPPPDSNGPLVDGRHSQDIGLSVVRLGFTYAPLSNFAEITLPAVQQPGTMLMPKFVVNAPWEKLTEETVLTDKAELALAEAKYISPFYRVTFGPLMQIMAYFHDPLSISNGWHPNEAEVMTLRRQDRRLEQLNELDSLIGLEMIDDSKDAKQFENLRYDAATTSR